MRFARRTLLTSALGLCLAFVAGSGIARGQGAFGFPSVGAGSGSGYPSGSQFGGIQPNVGYGIRTGQIGSGYRSSYGLNRSSYGYARPQTTIALQPLYSAITSLPGWNGPSGGRSHYHRARSYDPPYPHFDRDGKILWPGMIHDDPASAALRKEADSAFLAVYHESKTTGHASIRPVIATKQKLSNYERKVLPGIKGQSVAEGDELERFFVDLDRSLDQMNATF